MINYDKCSRRGRIRDEFIYKIRRIIKSIKNKTLILRFLNELRVYLSNRNKL